MTISYYSFNDGTDVEFDKNNLQVNSFNNNALEVYCSYAYTTVTNKENNSDDYVFVCSIIGNVPNRRDYEKVNVIFSSVDNLELKLKDILEIDDQIYLTPVSLVFK